MCHKALINIFKACIKAQNGETKSQETGHRVIFWPLIFHGWALGRFLHFLLLCKWNRKELVWVGSTVSKRHPRSPGHHVIFLGIIQLSLFFQSTATPGRSCHLLWALFSPRSLPFRGQRTRTRATFSPASQSPLITKDTFSSITRLALTQGRRSPCPQRQQHAQQLSINTVGLHHATGTHMGRGFPSRFS